MSSTTELWTPTQDLPWISQHLHTQHKEASPSLLHSPSNYTFHSSSLQGVQRKKTRPSWSVCEVPFHTLFIKLILPQFHSKQVQTKTKDAHTTKCKFLVWVKMFFNQKRISKMEKSTPGWAIQIQQWLWDCTSKNDCYKPQNRVSLLANHSATEKRIS